MTVLMSMWRNDADRNLEARIAHLTAKTARGGLRLLWVVGDSDDATFDQLHTAARADARITLARFNTGLTGASIPATRSRASLTATVMFSLIRRTDDYACLHESDLLTSDDIVDRLLSGPTPVAGWPIIPFARGPQFYDVWAYRDTHGRHFTASQARPTERFTVNAFGSCWLAPASQVRNRTLNADCVVNLCDQWRAEGVSLWCDPTITVIQPVELWRDPCA